MSWAEENGIDIGTDEVYIEDLWADGLHKTKDGREIEIKDMTDEHLQNTINCFKKNKHDVYYLEKEQKKRLTSHPIHK